MYVLDPGIEDLSSKRDELHRQILLEEEEKQRVQHDLHILTERLATINEGLAKKIAIRNDYDRTIAETEAAYKKVSPFSPVLSVPSLLSPPSSIHLITPLPPLPPQILESSQSLLHVLKSESTSLRDKTRTDPTTATKPAPLHRTQ